MNCGVSSNQRIAAKGCPSAAGKRALTGRPHRAAQAAPHTFATLSLQNGVDVKTLSNALGHYSAGFTLDTCTYTTQRMKREAADTIGNVIDQAM